MLKTIVLGTAAAIALAVPSVASPRLPNAGVAAPLLLVKHDKGEHGHGRKLGHFKQRGGDESDEDEHEWRSWSSTPPGIYGPGWYSVPPVYPAGPGYGSSLPPPGWGPPY